MPGRSSPADGCRICAGTGLTPATSAPELGSPLPHLRRDWAHPCHICAGTGRTPATSAPALGLCAHRCAHVNRIVHQGRPLPRRHERSARTCRAHLSCSRPRTPVIQLARCDVGRQWLRSPRSRSALSVRASDVRVCASASASPCACAATVRSKPSKSLSIG